MLLQPRLSDAEARTLAVQIHENRELPFRTWVSCETAELFRITSEKQPEIWQGTWCWPDGMVSMIPVLRADVTLADALAAMYEAVRNSVERQVLTQFPPSGAA